MKQWWVYYAYQQYMSTQWTPSVSIVEAEDRDNALVAAARLLKDDIKVLDVREALA
jgi:hypothetical protein